MGGQWHGGKGDKSRVSDFKSYRDNWEDIFTKKSANEWVLELHKNCYIMDPDGWRQNDGVLLETKITKKDFQRRFNMSTVMFCIPEKKKLLFLDDIRNPDEGWLYDENMSLAAASGESDEEWDIVRNYDEFEKWIETNGIPEKVSFDNDLHFSHMRMYFRSMETGEPWLWQEALVKMGAHAAQFLVDKCRNDGKPIPVCYVHTANDLARPVIKKILGIN